MSINVVTMLYQCRCMGQNKHAHFGDNSTIGSSASILRVSFWNLKLSPWFPPTNSVEMINLLSTFSFQKRLAQAISSTPLWRHFECFVLRFEDIGLHIWGECWTFTHWLFQTSLRNFVESWKFLYFAICNKNRQETIFWLLSHLRPIFVASTANVCLFNQIYTSLWTCSFFCTCEGVTYAQYKVSRTTVQTCVETMRIGVSHWFF